RPAAPSPHSRSSDRQIDSRRDQGSPAGLPVPDPGRGLPGDPLAAEELLQHGLEASGEFGVAFDARVEAVHGQARPDAVVEGLDPPGALAPRDVAKPSPVDLPVEVAERSVDEDDGGALLA